MQDSPNPFTPEVVAAVTRHMNEERADGSLLITSPHGTPSLSTWHYSGDVLTMVEEGLPHQATILRSTLDTFAISVAGSGPPVLLTFVPGTAK